MITNLKKVLTLFLTLILTFNLGVSAFAAAEDDFSTFNFDTPDSFEPFKKEELFVTTENDPLNPDKFIYYATDQNGYCLFAADSLKELQEKVEGSLFYYLASYCPFFDEEAVQSMRFPYDQELMQRSDELPIIYTSSEGTATDEKIQGRLTLEQLCPHQLLDPPISQIFDEYPICPTVQKQNSRGKKRCSDTVYDMPIKKQKSLKEIPLEMEFIDKIEFSQIYIAVMNKFDTSKLHCKKENYYLSDYIKVLKAILMLAPNDVLKPRELNGFFICLEHIIKDYNMNTQIFFNTDADFENFRLDYCKLLKILGIDKDVSQQESFYAEELLSTACELYKQNVITLGICNLFENMLQYIAERTWTEVH